MCLLLKSERKPNKFETEAAPETDNIGMQEDEQLKCRESNFNRNSDEGVPISTFLLADSVIIHCFVSFYIDLGRGSYCFLHLRNRF